MKPVNSYASLLLPNAKYPKSQISLMEGFFMMNLCIVIEVIQNKAPETNMVIIPGTQPRTERDQDWAMMARQTWSPQRSQAAFCHDMVRSLISWVWSGRRSCQFSDLCREREGSGLEEKDVSSWCERLSRHSCQNAQYCRKECGVHRDSLIEGHLCGQSNTRTATVHLDSV